MYIHSESKYVKARWYIGIHPIRLRAKDRKQATRRWSMRMRRGRRMRRWSGEGGRWIGGMVVPRTRG